MNTLDKVRNAIIAYRNGIVAVDDARRLLDARQREVKSLQEEVIRQLRVSTPGKSVILDGVKYSLAEGTAGAEGEGNPTLWLCSEAVDYVMLPDTKEREHGKDQARGNRHRLQQVEDKDTD